MRTIKNYRTPKSANAEGGRKAQSKLYSCPVCGSMGEGTKFIVQHLQDGCKGPGYRTRRNMKEGVFQGREQEAQLNTAIYNAQRMIKDERQNTKDMIQRIQKDIDRMKEMGSFEQSIF